MKLKFEWDSKKATSNVQKHGVTFEEASTVLSDVFSITIADPLHSDVEDRFVTIGLSDKQRLLVVVHTDRESMVRIISARIATTHERKKYEKCRH
jgi:hypothetical protein